MTAGDRGKHVADQRLVGRSGPREQLHGGFDALEQTALAVRAFAGLGSGQARKIKQIPVFADDAPAQRGKRGEPLIDGDEFRVGDGVRRPREQVREPDLGPDGRRQHAQRQVERPRCLAEQT